MGLVALMAIDSKVSEKRDAGKIRMPSASEEYIGEKYNIVEMELKDAGFTNVSPKPLNDLSEESNEEKDVVYKIMVDGDTDFSARSRHYPDANIYIYYHSFGG